MAYTTNEVAAIQAVFDAEGVITYDAAAALAESLGKSVRSVISKVKSLDLDYEPKPVAPKRPKGKTKAEMVADIETELNVGISLNGLDKATGQALGRLLESLRQALYS